MGPVIGWSNDLTSGPLEAFVQAGVINTHALKATGGKTYAQLDKEDPLRATAMNGSFLRSSLFTSGSRSALPCSRSAWACWPCCVQWLAQPSTSTTSADAACFLTDSMPAFALALLE